VERSRRRQRREAGCEAPMAAQAVYIAWQCDSQSAPDTRLGGISAVVVIRMTRLRYCGPPGIASGLENLVVRDNRRF